MGKRASIQRRLSMVESKLDVLRSTTNRGSHCYRGFGNTEVYNLECLRDELKLRLIDLDQYELLMNEYNEQRNSLDWGSFWLGGFAFAGCLAVISFLVVVL